MAREREDGPIEKGIGSLVLAPFFIRALACPGRIVGGDRPLMANDRREGLRADAIATDCVIRPTEMKQWRREEEQ
jgi:hypothetical protein